MINHREDMVNRSRNNSDDRVVNVERFFASDIECGSSIVKKGSVSNRGRCVSEPNIGYSVNYDDLCGPWRFPDNPVHARDRKLSLKPRLCVWELLTRENIKLIKSCPDDETAIKILIENRLKDEIQIVGKSRYIFLELAWSIIKFARDNLSTEDGTSALVGVFYLTYTFFLSNSWRTPRETYNFFYRTILLHTVENPPKSVELFTPEECEKCLEFFTLIILRHLPLVRFVAIPNYCLIVSNNTQED